EDRYIEPFAEKMIHKIGADEPSAARHQHTSSHEALLLPTTQESSRKKSDRVSRRLAIVSVAYLALPGVKVESRHAANGTERVRLELPHGHGPLRKIKPGRHRRVPPISRFLASDQEARRLPPETLL